MKSENESNASAMTKVLLTFLLLVFVLGANHMATRIHPQDVLVDSDSSFVVNGKQVAFQSLGTEKSQVIIGNQTQDVNKNDVVSLSSGSYIKITGNQVSSEGDTFYSGIFATPSKLNHVILFRQAPIEFPTNSITDLTVGDNTVTVSKVSENIFNIDSEEMNYNVELNDGDSTYITDNGNIGFYQIERHDDVFWIYLIGLYDEELKVVTRGYIR